MAEEGNFYFFPFSTESWSHYSGGGRKRLRFARIERYGTGYSLTARGRIRYRPSFSETERDTRNLRSLARWLLLFPFFSTWRSSLLYDIQSNPLRALSPPSLLRRVGGVAIVNNLLSMSDDAREMDGVASASERESAIENFRSDFTDAALKNLFRRLLRCMR